MKSYNEKLKHRLKQLRNAANLSQREVADRIGCKLATYQSYEDRGRTPKAELLFMLQRLYGLKSVNELYEDIFPEESIEAKYFQAAPNIRSAIDKLLNINPAL